MYNVSFFTQFFLQLGQIPWFWSQVNRKIESVGRQIKILPEKEILNFFLAFPRLNVSLEGQQFLMILTNILKDSNHDKCMQGVCRLESRGKSYQNHLNSGKSGKVGEFEKNVVLGQGKSGKFFLSKYMIWELQVIVI